MQPRLQPIRALFFALLYFGAGNLLQLSAQDQAELIPFIGYEVGTPHSIQREPGIINQAQFPTEGFGFSVNHTVLFGMELLFPQAFNNRFGISLSGSLAQADGRFIADAYSSTTSAINSVTGLRVETQNSFTVRATETQARVALLGSWRPWSRGTMMFGPWLGYRFSSNVTQTEEILSPDNAVFVEETERKRTVSAGESITSFNWRFGGLWKGSYNFSISDLFRISPFVTLQFDYESLVDKSLGLRAFSVGSGIGFSIDLFSQDTTTVITTNASSTTLPEFALSAEVDLYNAAPDVINSESLTVATELTRHTRYVPLLPFIRAGRDASDSLQWLTGKEAAEFSENDLAGKNFVEVQRHRLNLIAQRMHLNPKEELTLIPTYRAGSTAAATQLATEHAEEVRRYLVDVWGIESDRVHTENTAEGLSTMVRFSSTSFALLGPLVQTWQEEHYLLPQIGLRKDITAQAGLKDWEIVLRQGDTVISRIRNDEEQRELVILPFNDSLSTMSLEATLTAIDYLGDSVTATDHMLLSHSSTVATERHLSSWILLDSTGGISFNAINNAFIKMIATRIENRTTVEVEAHLPDTAKSGFTKETVVQSLLGALVQRGVSPEGISLTNRPLEQQNGEHINRIVVRLRQETVVPE